MSSSTPPQEDTPPTEPTPEQQKQLDKEARAKELAEQAQLPYKWTQTIKDLDITISIDAKYKGRDLDVRLEKKRLRVAVKGQEAIIDGDLPYPIHPDESTWTLETLTTSTKETTKEIAIHLDKANKMEWWAHVITSAPKIDTSKIQPENSSLSDLDGETRGMVEKMMWDQRQKEQGKPTSEEAKKAEMLEKFKRQHPEMDFSNAKMG